MKTYTYEDFDPEDSISLRGSRYHYGAPDIVAQARAFETQGVTENTIYILTGDRRDDPHDQFIKLLSELGREIKGQLRSGELIAFGFTEDVMAGPQRVPISLWETVRINFKSSKITLKGQATFSITDIVVFQQPRQASDKVDRTSKPANRAEIRRTYIEYVDGLIKSDQRTNREQDIDAMKAIFGSAATHKYIEDLRKIYAPPHWSDVGRRAAKKK